MSFSAFTFGVLLLCTEEADDEAEDAVERSGEFDEGNSILPSPLHFSSCFSLQLGLKLVLLEFQPRMNLRRNNILATDILTTEILSQCTQIALHDVSVGDRLETESQPLICGQLKLYCVET